MAELQRLTTEYVESEDRIRLSGQRVGDETVVMWISQRLLLRLLPHLFLWLEKQSGDAIPLEIAQSFAQDAARADLVAEPPVQRKSDSQEWLVTAVDLTPVSDALTMRFRSSDNKQEHFTMNAQQFRQWLEMLHSLWVAAEWPAPIWPSWLRGNNKKMNERDAKHLH